MQLELLSEVPGHPEPLTPVPGFSISAIFSALLRTIPVARQSG